MKTVTLSVSNRQAVKQRAAPSGTLRRNADGKIEFPFDAVHVDFMLEAA